MASTSLDDVRRQLGERYAIERELGRGGMGAVYLARDLKLDRSVALKVLPPEMAGDVSLRERFLRETKTAASFSHPNIVPVHSVEERDGLLAFAMGYVEGESLAERVERSGPLDVRSVVRVLQDVGYALAYAHGRGVIHRDIKPDNIMIERATGRALLMDFGISRSITTNVSATQGLTRVGEVVGTPEFMSPEQATGDTLDGRSDIYSLGLVALYALTGSKVITGTSTQQILVRQLTELPPPATQLRADLPASIGAAIDKCVAKAPDERFATAEQLVEAIDAAQVAAPEVPLAIRMFAHEVGTVSLIIFFLAVMSPVFARAMSTGGSLDALIPVVMIAAVGITRITQSFSVSRGLMEDGFTPGDVLKGMTAVADERASVRAGYRANPELVRRRKRSLRAASLLAILGVVLIVITRERAMDQGGHRYAVGVVGLFTGFGAFILLGIGFMTLMRSPFRPPPQERLYRVMWLGPFGRAFVRLSARGVKRPTAPATVSRPVVKTAPSPALPPPVPAPPADRLTSIEARLSALEKRVG
ncbi:MAG: serine/threonine-protein kinase [Gemmatimonadaceae bacterium]